MSLGWIYILQVIAKVLSILIDHNPTTGKSADSTNTKNLDA